ncbi:MAG TPA: flagellar biosynthesis protein FlhB [Alphaproteobacteria bacterium]|nr:flagellar biosynthesis protein FlhB [Alphaproteobacteria bacterium]
MAEENDDSQKTEDPSQRRLDDAHSKGQVPSSREINHWFIMFAMVLSVTIFLPGALQRITHSLTVFFESPHAIPIDPGGVHGLLTRLLLTIGIAVAPIFGLLLLSGIAASLLQVGPLFSAHPMKPELSKISPIKGFERIFSSQALVEFVKGIIKLAVVGTVVWFLMWPEFDRLENFFDYDMPALVAVLNSLSLRLIATILAVMAVIAGADWFYQRFAHLRKLRMSRQELRDEQKDTDGDPLVKGRLRQIRMERARRRMMQEVPKADVVITNPTHFAVALRYDQTTMAAPRVVAKGADLVARRIRELAEEHKVPIVSNPPLARALYASVELDQEIPPEHYKAVAEVIGYVMKLRRAGARPNA